MVTAFAVAFAQAVGIHPQQAELASQQKSDFELAQALLAQGDTAQGVSLLHDLAAKEYAPAEAHLGVLYITGEGVKADLPLAAIWFYRAARQGLPSGQLAFGSLYIDGRGVAADLVQAHMWLTLASARHDGAVGKRAKALIAQIEPRMTAAEIADAKALARNWKPVRPLPSTASY